MYLTIKYDIWNGDNPHVISRNPFHKRYYRQISNIRRTKFQTSNVSFLVMQFSLPNPFKPGFTSRMKT